MTEQEFEEVYKRWCNNTAHLSNVTTALNLWEALILKREGEKVVPFLLKKLESKPNVFVMILLSEITGVNPVPFEHYGIVHKCIEHWLEWGRKHGHI